MIKSIISLIKTLVFVVIAGAILITTFYSAYIFIFILVMASLFGLGMLYNNRHSISDLFSDKDDYYD